jgi:hypothetical protein
VADNLDDVEPSTTEPRRMARRDLLKKGAMGAGVAGVVWTSPEILGLVTRPAYAAASSAPSSDSGPPSNVSNVACTGDIGFNIKIPCPPDGHFTKDVVIAGGNCPTQVITVDSHWAVGQPHDATASRPNAFNDIHAQDKGPWKIYEAGGSFYDSNTLPPYLITSIKRANANCSFDHFVAGDAGVPGSGAIVGGNDFFFNPVTKQKFSDAAVTAADISIGWASDPNERADLGQPLCSDATSAKLHMHCT